MRIIDKKLKNGSELNISLEQEFFNNSYFEKIFGFELFTFQYWHDHYPLESITVRLTVCSICLRIHFYPKPPQAVRER